MFSNRKKWLNGRGGRDSGVQQDENADGWASHAYHVGCNGQGRIKGEEGAYIRFCETNPIYFLRKTAFM